MTKSEKRIARLEGQLLTLKSEVFDLMREVGEMKRAERPDPFRKESSWSEASDRLAKMAEEDGIDLTAQEVPDQSEVDEAAEVDESVHVSLVKSEIANLISPSSKPKEDHADEKLAYDLKREGKTWNEIKEIVGHASPWFLAKRWEKRLKQ